jgi:type I restriction enzyme S subunit
MCPTVEELPGGWQVKRLGSLCTKIGTGATPRGGSEVYLNSRVSHALIRSQHVFDRHFDLAGLAFISDSHAKELRNAEVQPGDVLLNITGDGVTFGRSCIVPDCVLPACVNQHVSIIRPDRRECDPGYLLSVLTHPETKGYIESFNSGGSRRAITKGHIESFEIALPPLAEQKAIAAVLGALDDKIELNRRMNATLETMARALFQSWFVDFDPVRAKVDGRQPVGLDPDTAALFPEDFEDSQLGQIPKGWDVRTIESLCDVITSGGTPARMHKAYWEPGTIPWFKTGELLDGPLNDAEERISEEGLTNSSCKLWPASTILFALYASPTVGRFGVLTKPGTANQAAAALIAKTTYGVPFLMGLLYEARAELQRVAVGAAQQNINQGVLKSHAVIVPPAALAKAYSDKVAPWFEQRIKLVEQSHTLATLRDAMLPKLLSGELKARPN